MLAYVHSAKGRENLALFLICALVLLRNFVFLIDGFGEQDAARLLNDAIVWSKAGYLDPALTDYRVRVSPLYIYALKRLVDLGVDYDTIIDIMNSANAVAGSLTFLVAFRFFRHFLTFGGALLGVVVLAFAPSVFLGSIYGMPHTIGFFFFLLSLTAFTAALLSPGRDARLSWWIGVPSLCLAAAIKADILLCAGAFLGVLVYARRTALPDLARAGAGIAAGALAPILLHGVLVPDLASASQAVTFASEWNQKYTIGLNNFFGLENALSMALFTGPVFLVLFMVAAVAALRSPKDRNIAILALLWILPVVLFWGLRPGNSARHLFPAVVPMALVLGWAVTQVSATTRGRLALALTIVIANYVWIPPMGNTVAPSTQILNSTAALQNATDRLMTMGQEIENSGATDHVLIGTGTLPYMVFNALRNADRVAIEADGIRIVSRGGAEFTLRQRYVKDPAEAKKAAQDALDRGRRVWSTQFNLGDLRRVR